MSRLPRRIPSILVDPRDANADVSDVISGKTFYAGTPQRKTGTLELTGNAGVSDVISGKTFYNTDPKTKQTGTGDLREHGNSEATYVGTVCVSANSYYQNVANGGTIVSASITTTKRCLIVVVGLTLVNASTKATDIRRGGVNKTVETTISGAYFAVEFVYGHLQYATEILDAGSYTYAIVNTSGAGKNVYGAAIKIVAIEFG
jgi:stage V sporulation protein SpoVS